MMDRLPGLFNELRSALSATKEEVFYEDHKALRIDNFQCNNQETFDLIVSVTRLIEQSSLGNFILSGEIRGDIDLRISDFQDVMDDALSLVIRKSINGGFYYFLTVQGLTNALTEQEFNLNAKKVWVAEKFGEFFTITCGFFEWASKSEYINFNWQGLSDPRKLVRDLSTNSNNEMPVDIRPWLLRPDQQLIDSTVFSAWKLASARNLSLMLPSEIRYTGTDKIIVFKGDKLREVQVSDIKDADFIDLFQILHDCSEWIYINRHDAEIKHTLLNYHLAFEWVGEEQWPNRLFIERALNSAHESYGLHSQESGRELLKAYDEIKKSLLDEVNKVSENTRGIIANFWRDFAIAAGVIVLNFATNNSLSPEGIRVIYTLVAAFLVLSLAITVFTNVKFNQIMQDNRNKWHEKLYPFIDNESLEEIVNKPISRGLNIYGWVVFITFIIYMAMSLYLLYLAYYVTQIS